MLVNIEVISVSL